MERFTILVPVSVGGKEQKRQYSVFDSAKKERGLPRFYKDEASAAKDCATLSKDYGLTLLVTPVLLGGPL